MGFCKKILKAGTVTVGGAYLINKGIDYLANIRRLLSDHTGSFYCWDGCNVFYTKEGAGSPVLLLHDLLPERSSDQWHKLVSGLSKNHTVYCVDLPGCGRSDRPGITYTSYYYVLFLKNFINNVIKEETSVIAEGNSCCFSLFAASDAECSIKDLTLINPLTAKQLSVTPDKKSCLFCKAVSVPILGTIFYNGVYNFSRTKELAEDCFYNKEACTKTLVDTFYESSHKKASGGKFLYASQRGGYLNLPVEHVLKNFHKPLLILAGEHVPGRDAIISYYTDMQPDIKTGVIPDTKYLPQVEAHRELEKQLCFL